MSYITQLDDSVIDGYGRLDEGKGAALKSSLDNLISLYQNSSGAVFGPGDQSSAHEAADYLVSKIVEIRDLLDDTDTRIDNLVLRIKTEIIDAEDSAASRIESEG